MRRLIASVVLASVAVASVFVIGCADAKMRSETRMAKKGDVKQGAAEDRAAREAEAPGHAPPAPPPPGGERKPAGGQAAQEKAEKPQRKVIFTGNVSLVVEDF